MVAVLTPDVLISPALPLLLALERLGCTVEITSGGRVAVEPASRLSAEQRTAFVAHARDLALLVKCCDAGVAERRDVMRRQYATAPPGRLPALLFVPGVPCVEGSCFSCADALQTFRIGRCWRCSLAWRLACRLPIPVDLADALDGARVT